ncbi:unnamed protein product, partial [marine sediment metagenome]
RPFLILTSKRPLYIKMYQKLRSESFVSGGVDLIGRENGML